MVTAQQRDVYEQHGYVVVDGLFSPAEIERYRAHFMTLRKHHGYPGDPPGAAATASDPLARYPRILQPHRWDDETLRWLLDDRLNRCLTALLGREPYAVQSMVYFKPPGARGQALHQDNFFLRAEPGTCMAAWMALDDCDEANGCMQIVPGSHRWPLLCTTKADTSVSFTDVTVPLPPDQEVQPIPMRAGDVLFFNGAVVHGSFPNQTADRFRRALIGHYVEGAAAQVAEFYHPALRMDGSLVELEQSLSGGACGRWVERDGELAVEVSGAETVVRKHE